MMLNSVRIDIYVLQHHVAFGDMFVLSYSLFHGAETTPVIASTTTTTSTISSRFVCVL